MSSDLKFGLSLDHIEKIVKTLKSIPGIETAKIFGSRATGKFREGSDIDIALLAPKLDHAQLLRVYSKLDDLMLPYKIDLLLIHQIDHDALLEHIDRVGVELW